jgi:hypothetical protein
VRKEGWEDRMLEEIERHSALPFEYGKSDCLVFAVDVARAISGVDAMKGRRGYKNEVGAFRALKRAGFADVGDALASKFEEVAPSLAQRGDLGVIVGEKVTVAVVFVGPYVVGKEAPGGIKQVSRSLATRAFRV